MKLNKLLVSSALILVLGLGACNTKKPSTSESEQESTSESQVDPVSRIKIEAPSTIVVGQPVDLDDYVTVEGGEGPKVFDVQIPATMTELVEVEGHQLTALAEGTINVKIIAGAIEAKFETDAMSALKAAFAEATAELSNVWAMDELYEGQLYVGAVHRADYSCFGVWDDDTNAPGGFLKAQNGKTYQYVLDDNFENIEVDSAIQTDFDLYYCNSEWLLSPSDFETVTDEEGNESLVMSGDLPGTWGSSSAPNKAAEFAYTLAQALNSKYMFNGIIVTPYTLGEGEDAVETFQFDLPIVAVDDKTTVLATYSYVLNLNEEDTEITAVREYIDSGAFPEAIAFDEAPAKIGAICEAKAYTANISATWIDANGTPIAAPTAPDWVSNFPVGSETDYVNATTAYQVVKLAGQEKDIIYGDIVNDGKLYGFNNINGQEIGDAINASLLEGSDVWADTADTLGAANDAKLWEGFVASNRTETASGDVVISATSDSCVELVKAIMYSSYIGYLAYYYGFDSIGTKDGTLIELGWVDVNFVVSEQSLIFQASFNFDSNTAYLFSMQVSGIGTDNVPDVSGIVYPEA